MNTARRILVAAFVCLACAGSVDAATNTNISATFYRETPVVTIVDEIAGASGMSRAKASVFVPSRAAAVSLGRIMEGTSAGANVYRQVMGGQWLGKTTAEVVNDMMALSNLSSAGATVASLGALDTGINEMMANHATMVAELTRQHGGIGSFDAQASLAADSMLANRIWAAGFGQWQDQKSSGGHSGYDYESAGVSLGYDRLFGNVMVGGSFSYGSGSLDFDDLIGDSHDLDSYSFGAYAKYFHWSGVENTLMGGYAYVDHEAEQRILGQRARSKYHTNVWSVGDILGYRFNLTDSLSLTPSAGLVYSRAKNSSYVVRGGAGNRVTSKAVESLTLPVNVELGYVRPLSGCSSLALTANVGWRHDFKGGDDPVITNYVNTGLGVEGYSLTGMKRGKNVYNAGVGAKYTRNNFELYAKYNYEMKSKYRSHQVVGGIGINF